jgi:hypothetical protein
VKCVFIRWDGAPLGEKHYDDPPVRGDFVSDVPGHAGQEWYVQRRRYAEGEVIELWVSAVT